jgi:hypothetical protein
MNKVLTEAELLGKEIERLKKRILSLNDSITLQAKKIGNTNVLMIIAREEKILQDRIERKKQAIGNLDLLRKKMTSFVREQRQSQQP